MAERAPETAYPNPVDGGADSPSRNAGVPSPCINVCRMRPQTQLCEGCLRTLDEIAAWSGLGDEDKRAVLRRLSGRNGA
ncbi:MAG: DUF1289 domain-containing protein [Betaproteobacteria bacterium]|nr:DUF1289 domain-containing protein [Betaproteobacteria bacterium]